MTQARDATSADPLAREAAASLVRQLTAARESRVCPEIRLHLASGLSVAWAGLEAASQRGHRPPYWAVEWAGGQALARYLLDTPGLVAGKRVLDFGAGGGICAIAAALAGARRATACDIDPLARAAVALNAALNGVAVDAVADDVLGRDVGDYDLVLAADVWYESDLARRATPWLRRQAERGVEVLLGDIGRNFFPRAGLERLALYSIATSMETEQRATTPTGVWRFSP
jgi:predicted nicotinamide N-methyase